MSFTFVFFTHIWKIVEWNDFNEKKLFTTILL